MCQTFIIGTITEAIGLYYRPRTRPPHEHRWDLAESEELVTFWILRVFDGKGVGFF
jgi:hypothetical protein